MQYLCLQCHASGKYTHQETVRHNLFVWERVAKSPASCLNVCARLTYADGVRRSEFLTDDGKVTRTRRDSTRGSIKGGTVMPGTDEPKSENKRRRVYEREKEKKKQQARSEGEESTNTSESSIGSPADHDVGSAEMFAVAMLVTSS